ncbi:uncharacterized protein VTP21DRAFT_292 [Calcarisporiella thermophila]|uniref:uncharacterized protein n=1 Tax=Calcarisporiella thermophila TaxID=911321 RepID=UPI003742C3BA
MASPLLFSALRQNVARNVRYASTSTANFAAERNAIKAHAADAAGLWRKISIFVCIPATVLASINCYNLAVAHAEHMAHLAEEEPTVYPYMKIRNKQFFWGDGDTSLFHNPAVNRY